MPKDSRQVFRATASGIQQVTPQNTQDRREVILGRSRRREVNRVHGIYKITFKRSCDSACRQKFVLSRCLAQIFKGRTD